MGEREREKENQTYQQNGRTRTSLWFKILFVEGIVVMIVERRQTGLVTLYYVVIYIYDPCRYSLCVYLC